MNHSIYERPPKAERNLVKQIMQSSTLVSTLGDALSELIKESNDEGNRHINTAETSNSNECDSSHGSEDMSSSSSNSGRQERGCSGNEEGEIKFDEKFKKHILDKIGEVHSDIIWQKEDSLLKKGSISSSFAGSSDKVDEDDKRKDNPFSSVNIEPPAALLQGNLQYYNKFNGQWRIVVSNPVLRPRVNVDNAKKKGKKRNVKRISLWEQSEKVFCEQSQSKRLKTGEGESNSAINQEFPMNQNGSVPLNGDLVILAYDDV